MPVRVLGIRKRSNSYYNFGVGIRGNRALLCYSHTTTTTYIRMYVMMNLHTKSGMYIRIYFFVNSQWYERVLETVAGLPRRSRRLARSFYTVTTYDVCMYVVAVDNESKLFIIAWWLWLHDESSAAAAIACCKTSANIFFLFSLRLLLACFVKFFKAELCVISSTVLSRSSIVYIDIR